MTELLVDTPGVRLDRFVTDRCAGLSRARVQKLIELGLVRVSGRPAKPGYRLSAGDIVSVTVPPHAPIELKPESIPLTVVHEDDAIIVVDKPAGMTVHPAAGNREHTLVNALLAHCPALAASVTPERPGIVHRLDKDTSGLMVIAKADAAFKGLIAQFLSRRIFKRYTALVTGHVSPEKGIIEAPIGRDPSNRKRMAVVLGGKESRTRYNVTEYMDGYSLLEITLETGRTHQIRVHLAAIGHPVAGDRVYGGKSPLFKRQFLHASALGFEHPVTGESCQFFSPLPDDLRQGLETLRRKAAG
ncbi:MAG: RluA family pseudouridine synthase [Chloroflexi bacterium]|nr:RluA family pseudouridine synthase [Chloroflexota bacterium]